MPTAGGSGATGASGCSAGAGRRWSGRSRTCLRPAACAASTFGARRIFENECSSTRRPSTSGSSCASGSALEPPVHCRASLPYKLHSQLRLQPASCAFSPVSGAFPPFLRRISPPHARRPASCTTTPRPRVRFLSQPSSAGHPLLPRAAKDALTRLQLWGLRVAAEERPKGSGRRGDSRVSTDRNEAIVLTLNRIAAPDTPGESTFRLVAPRLTKIKDGRLTEEPLSYHAVAKVWSQYKNRVTQSDAELRWRFIERSLR